MSEVVYNVYCCMFPECTKSYTTKYNLRRHVECGHLKVRPFHCRRCEKRFSSRQNLREHLQTHGSNKPYVCRSCSSTFRTSSQLALHKRIHQRVQSDQNTAAPENSE